MYRRSEKDFQCWLDSPIWKNGFQKEVRRDIIPIFANSVKGWMLKKGYEMDSRWGPMAVAKWLYAIQIAVVARKQSIHSSLGYPEILHRNWPEDQDNFDMNVGIDEREEFLDGWDACQDFDQSMPSGQKVRLEFEELLWTYVNLEESRQGRKIAHLIDESDDDKEDEYISGVDAYIQDHYENY